MAQLKEPVNSNNLKTPVLCTYLNNRKFPCLFDSGSNVSLISYDVYRTIFGKLDVPNSEQCKKHSFSVANKSTLNVSGSVNLTVSLGKYKFNHSFYVAENIPKPAIIGSDFMNCHAIIVDFANKCIRHRHLAMHFEQIEHRENNNTATIYSNKTVLIPPRTEMFIDCHLGTVPYYFVNAIGVCESHNNFSAKFPNVLVARSLVNLGKTFTPQILISNYNSEPVEIKSNQCLATFSTAEVLENEMTSTGKVDQLKPEVDLSHISSLKAVSEIKSILNEFSDIMAKSKYDIGKTSLVKHHINTGTHMPIKMAPRRISRAVQKEVEQQIEQLKNKGIITEADGPWAFPIVVVRKKDGTIRLCVDYRSLNEITIKDAFPLPRIDDTLDSLYGAKFFTCLDLASGYHQVPMDEESKDKTTFVTPFGDMYRYEFMPFGLCNAPATFQRLMNMVLKGLTFKACLVYLDDVIIFGRSEQEHNENLRKVFQRIRSAGLKLQPGKCVFMQSQVKYLGHVISAEGVKPDDDKIAAVQKWPEPTSSDKLSSFLGFAAYYRNFVRNFAEISAPLYKLTQKNVKFEWSNEARDAFLKIKESLCRGPVLAYPCFDRPFILDTDASNFGIGAVLSQMQEGQEKVIAYGSKTLSKSERNYSTYMRELLAVVTFVQKFRPYLEGSEFLLRTDHAALQWLYKMKQPSAHMARWLEKLAIFQFKIEHRPGTKHANADGLSRAYEEKECNLITDHTFSREQRKDTIISPIIDYLQTGVRPSLQQLQSFPKQTQIILQDIKRYSLKNNILMRTFIQPENNQKVQQVIVPKSMVREVLESLHDGTGAGHLGREKTLARVRSRFYWPGYCTDVENWLQRCDVCVRNKKVTKPRYAPLVNVTSGFPLQRVAIDFMKCPLSNQGNHYVLVAIDYFTKFAEAYPLPNQEAKTAAQCLVNNFFCRYGTPQFLHSDQGKTFESTLFSEVCKLMHINKTRTSPYHPRGDGLVERMNSTILNIVKSITDGSSSDWDLELPKALMAYNSSVQETTGFTPSLMFFGREMRLPIDLVVGSAEEETPSKHVEKLKENVERAYRIAREHGLEQQKRQKELYDRKVHGDPLKVGQLVWKYNPVVKAGEMKKFHQFWVGPYKVVKQLSEVTYRIQNCKLKQDRSVRHYDYLRPYQKPNVSGRELERNSTGATAVGKTRVFYRRPAPATDTTVQPNVTQTGRYAVVTKDVAPSLVEQASDDEFADAAGGSDLDLRLSDDEVPASEEIDQQENQRRYPLRSRNAPSRFTAGASQVNLTENNLCFSQVGFLLNNLRTDMYKTSDSNKIVLGDEDVASEID